MRALSSSDYWKKAFAVEVHFKVYKKLQMAIDTLEISKSISSAKDFWLISS